MCSSAENLEFLSPPLLKLDLSSYYKVKVEFGFGFIGLEVIASKERDQEEKILELKGKLIDLKKKLHHSENGAEGFGFEGAIDFFNSISLFVNEANRLQKKKSLLKRSRKHRM